MVGMRIIPVLQIPIADARVYRLHFYCKVSLV